MPRCPNSPSCSSAATPHCRSPHPHSPGPPTGAAEQAFARAETVGGERPRVQGASVLEATGLVKSYKGRRVVDDVSVRLEQGEIVGLLGPNGAGKTTTFYMITGLIRPERGRITFDGTDITSEPMYRRGLAGIGYLAQEPSVFRKLTVEENVLAILETLSLAPAERGTRLERLLDDLGIKHLRRQRAYQLSGGERRRLEITRSLVTEPKFMLLDEPFAGVDPIDRKSTRLNSSHGYISYAVFCLTKKKSR